MDTLRDGKIETLADTGSTQTKPITPERQKVYEPYMHSWESITSTMTDIEEQYALLRDPKSSTAMRSAILLTIKELQSELMAEAGIRKLFLVMRHPETESDKR